MSSDEEKQRVSDDVPRSGESSASLLPTVNPSSEISEPARVGFHPAVYIISWITISSSVILFNKWILSEKGFRFPISLTTWHLAFGTLVTQLLARTTRLLDGRKNLKMTGRVYLRAIVPIGLFFSLSLICGNMTYLYLSVSFIQMLKATTPVAVLFSTWGLGLAKPDLKILLNVSFIVLGVMIATFGEIKFVFIGFIYQLGGIVFEAIRLTMVERLLSSAEFKMDPLVSFYYFAPVCAIMNGLVALVAEVPNMRIADIERVGYLNFLLNGLLAVGLNICVVFLIGRTSSLVLTLSGVLKDVILVVASIAIFGEPVTPLQYFGYSIALGGMVWYKLGAEKVKGCFSEGHRHWAEYGAKHPVQRKIVLFVVAVLTVFVLVGGFAPATSYQTATGATSKGKQFFSSIID